jgi:hypothetical protein
MQSERAQILAAASSERIRFHAEIYNLSKDTLYYSLVFGECSKGAGR